MKIQFDELEQVNVNELKEITANAKEKIRLEEQRKREEEYRLEQIQREKQINEAKAILATVPMKLKQAAFEGKTTTSVMELDWNDWERENVYGKTGMKLKLKAKLVWDALAEQGLKPSIRETHDGFGERSWKYINANW